MANRYCAVEPVWINDHEEILLNMQTADCRHEPISTIISITISQTQLMWMWCPALNFFKKKKRTWQDSNKKQTVSTRAGQSTSDCLQLPIRLESGLTACFCMACNFFFFFYKRSEFRPCRAIKKRAWLLRIGLGRRFRHCRVSEEDASYRW